jgi:hypothetical protein
MRPGRAIASITVRKTACASRGGSVKAVRIG